MPESRTPPQPVHPSERGNHTFDFTADMASRGSTSIVTIQSVTLSVTTFSSGVDPAPMATVGTAQISGLTQVIVPIGPGLVGGVYYKRECVVIANDGQIYHQSWNFPCIA